MFGALLVVPACTSNDARQLSAGAAFGVVRCCDRNQSCHSICSSDPSDGRAPSPSQSTLAPRTCIDSSAATWVEAMVECEAHGLQLCASTVGFDAWKGRWKNRKRWDRAHETQPRPWSASPEAGTRPRRRRGVGARPAPTASHHLPRGGMAARAIQARGCTSESRARSNIAGPLAVQRRRAGRSQGMVRRRRVRINCARIRLRDGRGCWCRVSTQSACLQLSSVDGEEVPDHAWAACRRRVLSSCTLGRRRSGVLAEFDIR